MNVKMCGMFVAKVLRIIALLPYLVLFTGIMLTYSLIAESWAMIIGHKNNENQPVAVPPLLMLTLFPPLLMFTLYCQCAVFVIVAALLVVEVVIMVVVVMIIDLPRYLVITLYWFVTSGRANNTHMRTCARLTYTM